LEPRTQPVCCFFVLWPQYLAGCFRNRIHCIDLSLQGADFAWEVLLSALHDLIGVAITILRWRLRLPRFSALVSFRVLAARFLELLLQARDLLLLGSEELRLAAAGGGARLLLLLPC
jgi:hypothetical protein